MKYAFENKALKKLSGLERSVQQQIKDKLEFYMSSKNPLDFAEYQKEFELGEYRFRIGDYRATFDVKNNVALILKIGHRKDIYR